MADTSPSAKSDLRQAIASLPEAKRERVAQITDALLARHDAPRMKLTMKSDALHIGFDRDDTDIATLLQMADMGTTDQDLYSGLLSQIGSLGAHKQKIDERNSNFVVAVIRSVNPRDGLEALLATQMGAIHAATMMLARRLNHVETIPQQDAAERALNKLARTFATQMEALKRYRTGGQQKVTVEHVTVNSGGQAIVGAVATGGGGGK